MSCDWFRGGPELPDEPVAEEARLPSLRLPHRPVALGHLRRPRHSGHLQREVVGSKVSLSPTGQLKPRNFMSNYAVYWSQLTTTIQCSLQPVS